MSRKLTILRYDPENRRDINKNGFSVSFEVNGHLDKMTSRSSRDMQKNNMMR